MINEPVGERMAKLEQKVENIDKNTTAGFERIDTALRSINDKLSNIEAKSLMKEEYYRDGQQEKTSKEPWLKVVFTVVTNILTFITLALVAYILSNGGSIFK